MTREVFPWLSPAMIGDARGKRRGTLYPAIAVGTDRQFQPQTLMERTEVVDTAHHKHTGGQGVRATGQGAGTPDQSAQPLPKGCIEPFDKGRVDAGVTLRDPDQPGDQAGFALHDPAVNVQPFS